MSRVILGIIKTKRKDRIPLLFFLTSQVAYDTFTLEAMEINRYNTYNKIIYLFHIYFSFYYYYYYYPLKARVFDDFLT